MIAICTELRKLGCGDLRRGLLVIPLSSKINEGVDIDTYDDHAWLWRSLSRRAKCGVNIKDPCLKTFPVLATLKEVCTDKRS